MPRSKKGDRRNAAERRPVPITVALANRLATVAGDRSPDALLLTRPTGEPWQSADITRPFNRLRAALRLAPETTSYSLRHSSVVRQLIANVPVRVVAANHDTSVKMLEQTYSRYIADFSDEVTRRALLDPGKPSGDNIVPLVTKA
jgi:hypothetical protein